MTKYWIAKYVEDPMRNEPRNVGIFVEHNGVKAARFFGEREDGTLDARKLGNKFTFPNVYTQWRTYWRREMSAGLELLAQAKTANYFIEMGGEVSEAGADSADEVCAFLFDLLIGGGALDAYQWNIDDDGNVALATEITAALDHLQVLAHDRELFARHPVVKERPVSGHHVTHTPSFSQRNGALCFRSYRPERDSPDQDKRARWTSRVHVLGYPRRRKRPASIFPSSAVCRQWFRCHRLCKESSRQRIQHRELVG
jgi:hypothetical protein